MRRRPRSAPWTRERPSLTAERGLRGDAPRMTNSTGGVAMRGPRSRSRIEEPRGSRSAAGEVELPPRCPQSRAPLRARGGGKVTPAGPTHLAAPIRRRPRDATRAREATLAHRRARASRRRAVSGSRCRPRDRTPQSTGALAATAASFSCSKVPERTRSPAGRHRFPLLGGLHNDYRIAA